MIGQGGMAEVYKALDTRLDRLVALKLLRDTYARDPDFAQRFEREAKTAAGLSHPNIVEVYDFDFAGGHYFIAMAYVPGRTLKSYLRESAPLPEGEALQLTDEILNGLSAAHDAGLVHRDIKPQNVLLSPDGRLKIADFGIARAMGDVGMTEAGVAFGTPQYLSPEQAKGEDVSPATDVYAVGVMLYEMLTGRPPFDGEIVMQVVYQHVFDTPPPIRDSAPDASDGVIALVSRAMSKEPGERYRDASEMLQALRALEPGTPSAVGADETAPLVVASAAEAPSGPRTTSDVRRSGGRNWLWIAPLVLLLLIGGAAYAGGWFPGAGGVSDADPTVTPQSAAAASSATVERSASPGEPTHTVGAPISAPTSEPTSPPVFPTPQPTVEPTVGPTGAPTVEPTAEPTLGPTVEPTVAPTAQPTQAPTTQPTEGPPGEPPPAPRNLEATVTNSSVQLEWRTSGGQGVSYVVERSTSGGDFIPMATLPAGTTRFNDPDAEPATVYTYRVKAVNRGAESRYSQVRAETLLESPVFALDPPEGRERADLAQVTLEDTEFTGGFSNRRGTHKGRTARWVYTAAAERWSPTMTVEFDLPSGPDLEALNDAVVYFAGMDADGEAKTQVRIAVNGEVILEGDNPLPDDFRDPVKANWGNAVVRFPARLLRPGTNEISISNLDEGFGFQQPSWFMIDYAAVVFFPMP